MIRMVDSFDSESLLFPEPNPLCRLLLGSLRTEFLQWRSGGRGFG